MLLTAVVLVLALAAPASASHPSTWATPPACTVEQAAADYVVRGDDGERWLCAYDLELDLLYWEPVAATETAVDSVVWSRTLWTAPDLVSHVVMPRLERIGGQLHTGMDTYLRDPPTVPLFAPAHTVGVYSRLLVYDAATAQWTTCRDTGWVHLTVTSDRLTPTFAWGASPCGSSWYAAVGWVEHGSLDAAGALTWLQSPRFTTYGTGTQSAGSYASSGYLWDPGPGTSRQASRSDAPPKPAGPPPASDVAPPAGG